MISLGLFSDQVLGIVLIEVPKVEVLEALAIFVDMGGVYRSTIIHLTLVVVEGLPGRLDGFDQVAHHLETLLLILRVIIKIKDLFGSQSLDPEDVAAVEDRASDPLKVC